MRYYLTAVLLGLFAISCSDSNEGKSQSSLVSSSSNESKQSYSAIKTRNAIQIQSKGLNVKQAFLLYEDGKLVPETNTTSVGMPVDLRIIIDGGWEQKDGQVMLGASEKIETSDGDVLLNEKDLFKDIAAVRPEEAQYITLTANISRLDKLYDYFLVSFRVWDKNGKGEVNGSYKLHIQ
jgi:hypothetical protein